MKTNILALALALASTNAFAADDIPPGAFQPLADAIMRAYPDLDKSRNIDLPLNKPGGRDDVSFYTTSHGHIGCRIAGPPPRLVHCRTLKD